MIAIVVMIQGKVPRKIVFKSKIGTSSASVRTCAVCVKKENPRWRLSHSLQSCDNPKTITWPLPSGLHHQV
ncbi:hypothetical protein pipiens_009992 [Culex pipiens pipiens]|uniref:Uncharacterized protein n=1 Tax=Culex pipiens pipiens TaxID=38569 RepID=A0ABD1DBU6_CULPP